MWRTSFFSPTLFALNIKRYWPLAVAILVVVVIMPGMGILGIGGVHLTPTDRLVDVLSAVYGSGQVMVIGVWGAALLATLWVFGHLRSRAKVRFYHGLPVSRLCSFITNYLSALLLTVIPMALGAVVCMGFASAVGFPSVAVDIAKVLLAGVVVALLFVSLGALSCVLCGNLVGSALVYLALNFGVFAVTVGFGLLTSLLMPGIDVLEVVDSPICWFTPVYMLTTALSSNISWSLAATQNTFANPSALVVYAMVGVVLAVVAGCIYRVRRDETSGETVSFKPVRIVCKVLFALVFSAILTSIVVLISMGDGMDSVAGVIVLHLVFAALGWSVAEMIVRRSLRVFDRRSLIPCAVLLAAMLACFGLMRADAFGVVRAVPDPAGVESATVVVDGTSIDMDARDAVALHHCVIENSDDVTSTSLAYFGGPSSAGDHLRILYSLNDGGFMMRTYKVARSWGNYSETAPNLSESPIHARLLQIIDSNPRYLYQACLRAGSAKVSSDAIIAASVNDSSGNARWGSTEHEVSVEAANPEAVLEEIDRIRLGADEARELYEALCKDIDAGRIDAMTCLYGCGPDGYVETIGYIDFEYVRDDKLVNNGRDDGFADEPYGSMYVDVREDMVETVRWLDEHKGVARL